MHKKKKEFTGEDTNISFEGEGRKHKAPSWGSLLGGIVFTNLVLRFISLKEKRDGRHTYRF